MKNVLSMIAGFVGGLMMSGPALAQDGEIPDPAAGWDHLWREIIIDITVIGVVFGIAAIYMMIRYRAKSPDDVGSAPKLTKAQAIAWAMIPAAIFMADDFFLSAKGWTLWNVYRRVPDNAMEIKVTGYQWYWEFDYGDGVVTNELNVPVGQPVVLRMTSPDVIHSFFIPAYRVKEDVMPGRVTYIWINPRTPGTFISTCTEYCGTAHSGMYTNVNALPRDEFDSWLVEAKAEAGQTSKS